MPTLERTTPAEISTALFTSASLSALAAGAYVQGAQVTPPASSTIYDFRLNCSVSFTPANGTNLILYFLPLVDGTNLPNPPGATAQASPNKYQAGQYTFDGTATLILDMLGMDAPAYPFVPMLWNNSGVAFPTGTLTATLWGYSYAWV